MSADGGARQRIIDTASRLFQEQGYRATGLNQILRESGAPKGSLYYYFPDGKEDLAVHAVRAAADAIRETVSRGLDPHKEKGETEQKKRKGPGGRRGRKPRPANTMTAKPARCMGEEGGIGWEKRKSVVTMM